MKKVLAILVFAVAVSAAFAQYGNGQSSRPAGEQPTMRTLVGIVMDKDDQPLPNSVVYLKNTKTLTVKTFIAQQDGGYRFHALSPNVDYEVHAELKGKSSDTKTLSSFDSRPETRINLRIDTK